MIRFSHRQCLFTHDIRASIYSRCRNLSTARNPFDKMPVRNCTTWNSLISGYSHTSLFKTALNVCNDVNISGSNLDNYTCATMLNLCSQVRDLKHGKVIHGLVVVNGLINRPFVINSLMGMYSKFDMIDQVRLIFDRAKELDENSWNLLLSSYSKIGWHDVAVHILTWMHRSNVKLNNFALCTVLKASIGTENNEGIQKLVYGCVVKIGLDLDLFVGSSMVDLYTKNGGLEEAIKIFENIKNPDFVVFNAMIAGFCRLGNETSEEIRFEGLRLYCEMIKRRIRPNKYTLKSVLEVCSLTKSIEYGKIIHAHLVLNGLQNDEFINCALISLHSNFGLVSESLKCFDLVPNDEIFGYSTMIDAFVQNHLSEKAFYLFKESFYIGLKPDCFILTGLINACTDLGLIKTGEQIHGYIIKSSFEHFTMCCNSLIDMYSKIGEIEGSIRVFEETKCLDMVSWGNMILGFAINGCEREALDLFENMEKLGVKMDKMVFFAVLNACSNGGFLNEGFRYYEKMITYYGISPNGNHISCMVDLLGKKGKLNEAQDFITDFGSKYNSNPLILQTLLRASRFYNDKERGMSILNKLIELDPLNANYYIILYNIYTNIGKISLAMRTRGLMRQRGAIKKTGLSWIETRPIKIFTEGNENNHLPLECNSLHAKIKHILIDVKEKNKNNERDIWETEFKSDCKKFEGNFVKMHGELLAVCFGLSCLGNLDPIRVLKNEKVSYDSHEVLKLISESEKREIFVRDPTHLHRFKKGFCSCGDYW